MTFVRQLEAKQMKTKFRSIAKKIAIAKGAVRREPPGYNLAGTLSKEYRKWEMPRPLYKTLL